MASSGLPRKYRSTEAVEHVLENAADDGLMQVFFSDAAWSLIPPARRTERFQHESFSLLSCIRCVMSEAFFCTARQLSDTYIQMVVAQGRHCSSSSG